MKMIKDPQNIIVRMPNWVGDLVMATSVLSDLKKAFPKAHLTVVVQEGILELLKEDKNIDELIYVKKSKNIFCKNENKDVISKLRKTKFDLGILLTNSFSSAYFFLKAGIKNTIGYKKDFRSLFIKYPIKFIKKEVHQIDKYKNLLRPLNIEVSNTNPRLYFDLNEIKKTKELLFEKGFKENNKLIGINPLAKYGIAKCWPIQNFEKVAKELAFDKNNFIVFTADNASKDLIDEICKNMPKNVISLAGLTSLRQLVCIINECDLFITNDSGPMHIASALNRPLIAIFGSTSQILTGPCNDKAIVINKKVDCSPCFRRNCPKDFKCMQQITTQEIMMKIKELLKNA